MLLYGRPVAQLVDVALCLLGYEMIGGQLEKIRPLAFVSPRTHGAHDRATRKEGNQKMPTYYVLVGKHL